MGEKRITLEASAVVLDEAAFVLDGARGTAWVDVLDTVHEVVGFFAGGYTCLAAVDGECR
jgi:hypothetical protein